MSLDAASPAGTQTSQRRHSSGVLCHVCKFTGKAAQLLQCVNCPQSVHLACLHKQFKEVSNEPLKNKIDWLGEFIKHASLVYCCKVCTEKSQAERQVATTTEITHIVNQISDVMIGIEDLKSKMTICMTGISSMQPAMTSVSSVDTATALNSTKPAVCTYVQVLSSKDISIAVEAAMSRSLASHQKQSVAVVMYGMCEYGNDWDDVADIFQLISCRARPLKLTRIGSAVRNNTRPLRIELSTLSDSREAMACARELKRHDRTWHLRLSLWLSEDEMI